MTNWHTYKYIYNNIHKEEEEEMIISENQKIELFDKFYNWIKEDGLKPKRSERLHKKKIFASLLANDEMTIENFKDFLNENTKNEARELLGRKMNYKEKQYYINNIEIKEKEFVIVADNLRIICTYRQLDEIKKNII